MHFISIYAYIEHIKKSKKIFKIEILHENLKKIACVFKGRDLQKTSKPIFSASIDFEAYSLKFLIFALHHTLLTFFLLTFRQNKKFSFFQIFLN